MIKLTLTKSELENLMQDDLKGFKVLNDDIPKQGHSSQYIERDGRQYRKFEFQRLDDELTFNFSYVWYTDDRFEANHIFDNLTELGIEIVDDPIIIPEPTPKPVLTKEQQNDKDLMQRYKDAEPNMVDFDKSKDQIPLTVVMELVEYINNGKYNIYQLRAKIIPVSIKYNVTHKSLWSFLQRTRGAWTK